MTGDIITVTDRSTRLSFACKRPADRMFGETFHTKVYDIPFVPLREGDVVIDVGANHGFFSCYAGFRGARVYAFEPQEDTFELLMKNIARHKQERLVQAFPWAITGADGEVELFVTDALGGGMSSVVPQFVQSYDVNVTKSTVVRSVSLPKIIEEFSLARIRVLKLDCEGSELDILKTLDANTLSRIDAIAMEHHAEAYAIEDLIQILLSWDGFHVSKPNTEMFGVTNSIIHVVRGDVISAMFNSEN